MTARMHSALATSRVGVGCETDCDRQVITDGVCVQCGGAASDGETDVFAHLHPAPFSPRGRRHSNVVQHTPTQISLTNSRCIAASAHTPPPQSVLTTALFAQRRSLFCRQLLPSSVLLQLRRTEQPI